MVLGLVVMGRQSRIISLGPDDTVFISFFFFFLLSSVDPEEVIALRRALRCFELVSRLKI